MWAGLGFILFFYPAAIGTHKSVTGSLSIGKNFIVRRREECKTWSFFFLLVKTEQTTGFKITALHLSKVENFFLSQGLKQLLFGNFGPFKLRQINHPIF